MQYINKIGCEIEADVKDYRREGYRKPRGWLRKTDGSISSSHPGISAYEYISTPSNSPEKLKNKVKKLYASEIVGVNKTEGLHIHVSFNKQWFYCLASNAFIQYFYEAVTNSRLYKQNPQLRERVTWCDYANWYNKDNTDTLDQELNGRGDRYRAVNYMAHYAHQTLEFRIFPAMETAEEVGEAIDLVVTTINSYLHRKPHYLHRIDNEKEETEPIKIAITSEELRYNETELGEEKDTLLKCEEDGAKIYNIHGDRYKLSEDGVIGRWCKLTKGWTSITDREDKAVYEVIKAINEGVVNV